MTRTDGDVLDELTARGLAGENEAAARSYIGQAADAIRGYCGLPEGASLPAGLFYAWVEVSARLIAAGGVSGAVSSITEGDTTIQFGGLSQGADAGGTGWALDGCRAVLNRYRRMAW